MVETAISLPVKKTLFNSENKLFYFFCFISIAGIVLNAFYEVFQRPFVPEDPVWILVVGFSSTFTDCAIALYLASKLLGLSGSFTKSIWVSIFFYVVTMALKISGFSLIFFSIGIFIIIGLFVFLMRIYQAGIIRTVFLILLQVLFVFLMNLSLFGLYKFLKLFS